MIKGYVKIHKKSIKKNFKNKKINILFSKFFILSLSFTKISYKQLESARRAIVRKNLKFCFILNKIKPFFNLTKKSKKSRMGKGIGKFNTKIYNLKPGNLVFEVIGINTLLSIKSIKKALLKLPGFFKILKVI